MGKWIHKLNDIIESEGTAVCQNCGPISYYLRPSNGRKMCPVARKDMMNRHKNRDRRSPIDKKIPSKYGNCAICGKQAKLVRDHDHDCCNVNFYKSCGNCFRGYICSRCNYVLSFIEDKLFVQAANNYLRKGSQ